MPEDQDQLQQASAAIQGAANTAAKEAEKAGKVLHDIAEGLKGMGQTGIGDAVEGLAGFVDKVPEYMKKGKEALEKFDKEYTNIKPILEKVGPVIKKAFSKFIEGVKAFINTTKTKSFGAACKDLVKAVQGLAKKHGVSTGAEMAR